MPAFTRLLALLSAFGVISTADKFRQAPHRVNAILDTAPFSDLALPPGLQPSAPTLNGSFGGGAFYLQKDGKTGVLALRSSAGLLTLKELGATQLVIDVTNNGGGFICVGDFTCRCLSELVQACTSEKSQQSDKRTSYVRNPTSLDTKARDGPFARRIVQHLVENNQDPVNQNLLYNPLKWNDANGVPVSSPPCAISELPRLLPPVNVQVNGHADAFSQRLGHESQPRGLPSSFDFTPPDFALFNASKVVIVSTGWCASSCSTFSVCGDLLFQVAMSKEEGVKTVVVGGKNDVKQEYCGTVGGSTPLNPAPRPRSTDPLPTFRQTTQLKNNSLAPPDLLVNGVQGITWRLGFGIDDPEQPEGAYRVRTISVNNPVAIWEALAAKLLA
ncbi:hypothetical protein B0H10DRAFT_1939260 [Mycena sp. CBHHK59/15]|nr:hypothetical protein B0H10DRAFT_1939260 [Mycena sp. CBHHK59/15]